MSDSGKSPQQANDLYDFMLAVTQDIAREYERIQKRATEDPGTAGDQGEENWATLLRGWLPPTYQVVTKGRILFHDGLAGPQVDVLVLRPSYPSRLLDKKLYLAGGVAAAFECKVTLKAGHIEKTVENSAVIRRSLFPREGSPYKELNSPILYGLLAHSHSWVGESSTPIDNVNKHLTAADLALIKHPREYPDLLCVADLGCWLIGKMTYIPPVNIDHFSRLVNNDPKVMRTVFDLSGVAVTSYACHSFTHERFQQVEGFTPIGAMLYHVMTALAWEDATIRPLADYFRLTNLRGSGHGYMRKWGLDIYSEKTRGMIERGESGSGERFWNEWGAGFF